MDLWQEFHGPNAAYILDLYERFRQDPTSVDPGAQALFQQWQPNGDRPGRAATERRSETSGVSISADKVMAVVNLATAIREYGHLADVYKRQTSFHPKNTTREINNFRSNL